MSSEIPQQRKEYIPPTLAQLQAEGPEGLKAREGYIKHEYPKLLRIADRQGAGNATPDVVQSAVERVLRKLPDLKSDEFLSAYFAKAVVNEAINVYRLKESGNRLTDFTTEYGEFPAKTNVEGEGVGKLTGKELGKVLEGAKVDRGHLEILLLHADGLSNKEIAEKLGINQKTVGTGLYRARQKIKPLIEPLVDPKAIEGRKITKSWGKK